ncbi:MAG TPA: tRNA (adenosine(37)-N6)-dimethylallyltransferase MiaA [Patescibacteria group bacterium]|nr:tRNA (adenosine(37)-N6)-dimethylallyltransferase MiaA [Patescibacteria group bacterium]
MKKAIFIVGPTATGKTDLALKIYNQILVSPVKSGSVLISADAVQVFRSADIISGKDLDILGDTPIENIDVVDPTDSFSIKDFKKKTELAIKEAQETDRLPIVVGGTGYYFDALFSSIDTLSIKPNKKLRKELEEKSLEELQKYLGGIDQAKLASMNNSDVNNKRRIIRAIEVIKLGVKKSYSPIFAKEDVLFIGLKMDRNKLKDKIKKRVEDRIKNGALDEARRLFVDYDKLSPQLKSANGYKQLFSYLSGKINFEEAIDRWVIADSQHAKKQMTWFRKNDQINWFDVGDKDFEKDVFRLVKKSFTI